MDALPTAATLTIADLARDVSWSHIPRVRIALAPSGHFYDLIEPADSGAFFLIQENRSGLRRRYVGPAVEVYLVDTMRQQVEWQPRLSTASR